MVTDPADRRLDDGHLADLIRAQLVGVPGLEQGLVDDLIEGLRGWLDAQPGDARRTHWTAAEGGAAVAAVLDLVEQWGAEQVGETPLEPGRPLADTSSRGLAKALLTRATGRRSS